MTHAHQGGDELTATRPPWYKDRHFWVPLGTALAVVGVLLAVMMGVAESNERHERDRLEQQFYDELRP